MVLDGRYAIPGAIGNRRTARGHHQGVGGESFQRAPYSRDGMYGPDGYAVPNPSPGLPIPAIRAGMAWPRHDR
jgi:hypothetical protein